MKRRIAKLCVLLLLGAIVNVAVAWGCGTIPRHPSIWKAALRELEIEQPAPRIPDERADALLPLQGSDRLFLLGRRETAHVMPEGQRNRLMSLGWRPAQEESPLVAMVIRGEGMRRRIVSEPIASIGQPAAIELLAGWPMLSLYGARAYNNSAVPAESHWYFALSAGNPTLSEWELIERMLPLRPIFPGFAINTIFYAAILWLLFAGPGRIRRWRRRRRGLCPSCAYPVGQSPACTECGAVVQPRRGAGM